MDPKVPETMPIARLLLDTRPAAGSTGARGVGRYVSGLREGLAASRRVILEELVEFRSPEIVWARLQGARAVRESGADLYHATFLAPLSVPSDFPWVSTIHDLIPLRYPRSFSWKQLTVFRLSLRWNARATRVVAVSPFTAELVSETLGAAPDRVRVVPPPVDVSGVEKGVAHASGEAARVGAPYLFHCSGFDPLKGVVDLLLPAMAGLHRDHPDLSLVMTGPPSPWRSRAERAAAELGLAERVHFPGLVSDAERAALLRHASALVVSSREEGFGIPAIEGLAAGLPVVVGPAQATRWAVGAAGHLAPSATPEGLADAIREALEAPGSDDAAASEARRKAARRFAPEEVARQMIEVYEEALS